MSNPEPVVHKPEGPPRIPGQRAVRPKNAATVMIIRRDAKKPRVLMGTPPAVGKRFDTWFLTADAERLTSLDRQPDCGELEEIDWVDFDDAMGLPLPTVTRMMIKEAVERMKDPSRPKPFLRYKDREKGMRPASL